MSKSVWDSLGIAFQMMRREDLVQKLNARDINIFRDEFDF